MDGAGPSPDAARPAALHDAARLAASLAGCPIGHVVLLEAGLPVLKAAHGIDPALLAGALDHAFSEHAITGEAIAGAAVRAGGLLALPDVAGARFHAGVPLVSAAGDALGALCVADTVPRALTPAQREGLALLAARLVADLALHRRLAALDAAEAEIRARHDRLDLDFNAALDGLADGVVTLASDGAVLAMNQAAATMLGLDAAAAPGATLLALLPGDGTADELLDVILAPVGGPVDGAEAPPRRTVTFGARRLSVVSRAYRLRVGAARGRLGLTATLTDVTETERLAEAEAALSRDLADQHRKLQTAYLQLENGAIRMQQVARRVRLARMGAAAGVALLLLATGAYAWLPAPSWHEAAPSPSGAPGITLVPQPVSARISVVGMLDAGSLVSVVGPFDGLVQERLFQYGGQVERGQPLLRLNLSEVEVRLRDARSAQIRARQRVAELRGWTTGFEVARARRALAQARLEATDLNARVAQTRMLLSRGIIAADEHRALVQQQRNQQLQVQAAENDLEATLARGDAETLRIAELELANAEAKVRELETDLANATVLAPVSGVVLMPPEGQGGRRPETVEAGSRVQRGQTMFTIGALETFQVRATVDEIDVNKVRVGQRVTVTGDAFGDLVLEGRVTAVAAQAGGESAARQGMPSFPVSVAVEGLSPDQRRQLAVGMSASLSIVTYDNPAALVLPPYAVQDQGGSRAVRVRRDGVEAWVPVVLGISTPDGIEIRSGLVAGDVVLP
ncbi:HlyD family efflux transporter periplasmic adaptor subunit [Roseomonas frigidaquae]|uniref:HlyD family efflux transporter periplasmic adaptor subunit n=1 Tax=Falsiroseomonas frigidaquae TaxID=487318 RepID=A0ABX1EW21_9PROT|nr:HlyD family efflux transporter periplasmic adaptor subunit [Falsiroseomonas frigidaquae]NKE43654.1 HlyD family efflux transporter periplasmic adaptor subunit [Falsiroseomonas frigidaquae]